MVSIAFSIVLVAPRKWDHVSASTTRFLVRFSHSCAANRLAVVVPCHRVVKKDGSISGYRWGFKRKRALIEREREGVARRCQPQAGMEIR